MASKSSSQNQPKQLTRTSNIHFEVEDSIINFNNGIALLESQNALYHPVLQFLKNSCIYVALTKQPSTYYSKYLQEFWYSAEADSAMKTITFTLSCFDKPLSIDLDVFSTVIGLSPSENYVSVPLKEIVKAGLATLGLFDEKHSQLSSCELINSQQIIAYCLCWGLEIDIAEILFSDLIASLHPTTGKKERKANICYIRYPSLIMEHMPKDAYKNDDLMSLKPCHITATTFKPTLKNKFALTAHMCKVAELSLDLIKSLLLPSGEVNVDDTTDKSLSRTSVHLEKVNESGLESIWDVTFDQIMDEINQKNKAAQENLKARVEPSHFKYDQTKLTKHGDSDSRLCSMPDDDLVSLTSFENPESTNNDSQAGTAKNFNASTDMPDQSDPLGHLHEELCTLNTKVDQLEFDISKKVIKDSIKQSVLDSIEEKLHVFDAQVKQTLQDQRPNILKLMNNQFNAFNTMESRRFVTLQYELSKVIKTKLRVLVRNKVHKRMHEKFLKRLMLMGTSGKRTTPKHQLKIKMLRTLIKLKGSNIKKLKFLIPTSSSTLSPTPLKSILPKPIKKPEVTIMTFDQFTKNLTKTTSSILSPTPPRELTLPRDPIPLEDESKGNGDEKLADLKAEKEKYEKSLQKIMDRAIIRAQAQKMVEYEAKRKKMLDEYNHQISYRADQLPITKINYRVNSSKEATMGITRGNDPLNLTVYDKFRLKTLGFSE
uniref:Uncharacterized protein n=1 Tax=Tanacetum cinerariifolium TaxID=118510 RepID=A0A699J3W8_TANCI|nr:hypothetical protein [Tanacetum cinerariifolium]